MKDIASLNVPKAKINQLLKKGFETTEDLLRLKPLHYDDFTTPKKISSLKDGEMASVFVKVTSVESSEKVLTVNVEDEEGDTFRIVFFNQFFMKNKIYRGKWYTFGGKIKRSYPFFSMANPFLVKEGPVKQIQTRYSKIKGMSDEYLRKCIALAGKETDFTDELDVDVKRRFELVSKVNMFRHLHYPKTMNDVKEAEKRLLFEKLFAFNVQLIANQEHKRKDAIAPMGSFSKTRELLTQLPFELTVGQRSALREISFRMKKGTRLNALIQGDVGSGKTMIALFSMLIASESGFQSAIMAPTNVLAKQHFNELTERLQPLGVKTTYISGELKAKEKRQALKEIESGESDIIIGTHAAISENVVYNNLGLIVVDEEHRFGVAQRESFSEKGGSGVHVINMSATPIPRSLAMSLYGDDVLTLTITSMPKGRVPIKTKRETKEVDAYEEMLNEVKKGRQGYIVCPLIEENENMENVESVEETFEKANKFFSKHGVKVGMIHGRMKPEVVAEEINAFAKGDYDILISTTIIEVGVNVPNATIILIKSAERFGLAQLHQLRGRVGRSSHASQCILLSNNETDKALFKLKAMTDTSDGFIIAKKDMELRGTGDIVGLEQSGNNQPIQLMLSYPSLHEKIRKYVLSIQKDSHKWNHYKKQYLPKE